VKINGSGAAGATDLLHLCKQYLELYPSPCRAGEGRLKIPSSNLMPAHFLPSPAKWKKGRGREGAWAGAAGGKMVPCRKRCWCGAAAPKPAVTLEIGGTAPGLLREQESELWHRVRRRAGAGAKPSESGKSLISRGFGAGSCLRSKEGFYFDRLNLQYLYVWNKIIIKVMLNLCPSPLRESAAKSNIKNPNCKALFYCLFSTFLTLSLSWCLKSHWSYDC